MALERFSLDCRIGIGFGFGFGFTTSFGWLVYLLWFWFYDSQVKTALMFSGGLFHNNLPLCISLRILWMLIYVYVYVVHS